MRVAKDLTPLWIDMLRSLDLLAGRSDDRHAVILLDLLILGRVPIGLISRDHLDGQPHGLGKGHEPGEKKIIMMIGGGNQR